MTDKRCLEKAIIYLEKYLKGQNPKSKVEIADIKAVREQLNSIFYKVKND